MDTNYSSIGYVEETTFGTTPSAALQLLRTTGGGFTPTQNTIVSQEIRADLRAGKPVRTSQLANASINVEWSYNTLHDVLEGMLMEDWDSTVLEDGTTKKSYTFEEQYEDPEISPSQYMIYKGCRIAGVSMSMGIGAIVSGTLQVMSATPSIAQASAGTGDTAETTTGSWNTVDMVDTLNENAVALSRVVSVNLNITRSIREKMQFGSINPFDLGTGRLIVNGSIQYHFENDVIADAWFAFGDRSLTVNFIDEATNEFLIEIPKMKYVGDYNIERPGVDTDVLATANFEAYATATDDALIRFTETAA